MTKTNGEYPIEEIQELFDELINKVEEADLTDVEQITLIDELINSLEELKRKNNG